MRLVAVSIVCILGLTLTPMRVWAQDSQNSVPPPNPRASVTTSNLPSTEGSGSSNSRPVGGPGVSQRPHPKRHKRAHRNFYGKHHDYMKSSPAEGPVAPHYKTLGTN
jgi:hypothetical protein